MKQIALFFILMSCICINLYADGGAAAQINLQKKKTGTHLEQPTPADMPEAYYDTNTEEIIIVADGFSSYYDVDIVSQSTMQLMIYTTISGYGDNIDVSSLPDDNYTIIITSSYGNEYEGQFTNY